MVKKATAKALEKNPSMTLEYAFSSLVSSLISHGDLLTLRLLSHRLVGPNGDVEPEKKAAGGDCGEGDKACGGSGGKLDW